MNFPSLSPENAALLKASREVARINPDLLAYEVLYLPAVLISSLLLLVPAAFSPGYLPALYVWATGPDPAPPGWFWPAAILAVMVAVVLCMAVGVARYAATDAALRGERMPMRASLAVARSRIRRIVHWMPFALVGGFLAWMPLGGGIVDFLMSSYIDIGWNSRMIFTFPLLTWREMGPVDIILASPALIERTWSGALFRYSLGGVSQVTTAVGALLEAGICFGTVWLLHRFGVFGGPGFVISLASVALVSLGLILWASGYVANVQAAFITTLFRYAETGDYVGPFPREVIQSMTRPRKFLRPNRRD